MLFCLHVWGSIYLLLLHHVYNMAKTVSMGEQMLPMNGRWGWNESAGILEYVSNNPHAEKMEKKAKEKNQKRGGIHAYDNHMKKPGDRGATPSMGSRTFGQGRQSRVPGHRSPTRHSVKQSGDHTHIMLQDVKSLALNMLSEVDAVSDVFEGMYGTDQFDEFLLFLLNFFHCFFEKRTHEQKPNPMNIEPSLREVKYYEDLCVTLEAAQKQLGKAYCVLVLGIGLVTQHHMACGMSRVSNTYKDRSMYETFYSFCTFVVWIAFRRREYEIVKKEIGRMLRSETFNPAIRVKNATQAENKEEDSKEKNTEENDKNDRENEKEKVKMTPAEYRRQQGKRPPIKSIINQRSPALVSILPSPKEESNWLFKRTGGVSPTSMAAIGKEELDEDALQNQFQHLNIDVSKLKVGIVGEPASQYHPITLTPLDGDTEEEGHEDGDQPSSTRRGSQGGSTGKTPQSSGDTGPSRQVTAISQATTEAMSDED